MLVSNGVSERYLVVRHRKYTKIASLMSQTSKVLSVRNSRSGLFLFDFLNQVTCFFWCFLLCPLTMRVSRGKSNVSFSVLAHKGHTFYINGNPG